MPLFKCKCGHDHFKIDAEVFRTDRMKCRIDLDGKVLPHQTLQEGKNHHEFGDTIQCDKCGCLYDRDSIWGDQLKMLQDAAQEVIDNWNKSVGSNTWLMSPAADAVRKLNKILEYTKR